MLQRPLLRELSFLLLIKIAALVLLYAAFFSPSHRIKVDSDVAARALLSTKTLKEKGNP